MLMLALTPSAGAAARVLAPPGLPEAEQYYETLPTSTGPRAPDAAKKAHDAVRDGTLSEATEQALRRRGATGLAIATAVAQTAPGGGRAVLPPALGSLAENGLRGALPFVLILIAAAGAAFALTRRRLPSR
jgi:hypothetical protein